MADDRIFQVMRDMIEAGATAASVGHAVALIQLGRPVREAADVIVYAPIPATFNADLLLAEAVRAAEAVKVAAP